MRTVNMHEAKTHLSRLVNQASDGEPFLIAKAGKPLVKVIAFQISSPKMKRVGFLKGQFSVPDDFDQMGAGLIEKLFGGEE